MFVYNTVNEQIFAICNNLFNTGVVEMKIKIVNRKRFIKRTGILLGSIIFSVIIFVGTTVSSYKEVRIKTKYINEGDTLWKIAQAEQIKNEYYKDKDIRYIIEDIKNINNLNSTHLYINQELLIHCN